MVIKNISVVYSKEHKFSTFPCMETVAISCRGPVENKYCGVGFEQSLATLRLRSKMISGWYSMESNGLQKIDSLSEIEFEPEIANQRFWKLLLRGNGTKECTPTEIDNLEETITNIEDHFKLAGSQERMLKEFCSVIKTLECSFMYWPLGTKFWSICYLFSDEINHQIQSIRELANAGGIPMVEVAENDLPVY